MGMVGMKKGKGQMDVEEIKELLGECYGLRSGRTCLQVASLEGLSTCTLPRGTLGWLRICQKGGGGQGGMGGRWERQSASLNEEVEEGFKEGGGLERPVVKNKLYMTKVSSRSSYPIGFFTFPNIEQPLRRRDGVWLRPAPRSDSLDPLSNDPEWLLVAHRKEPLVRVIEGRLEP